jgi:hypothetical protein
MNNAIEAIQSLTKALEAGGYNVAPGNLVQGAALQVEDLSSVMEVVTFDDSHLKLAKMIKVESCKSTLAQFDRQLSYGNFGASAQLEGAVGQEETSDYVRITVPMCFYSHTRRVTLASTLVETVDGKKADERAAADAAKKLAADIEFDCFRGRADFSNAGVFDGNPLAIPLMPNMYGLDVQVRQSDAQRNTHDLMLGEYGSDDSVVIYGGGTLSQDNIEDATTRSAMNLGSADKLVVDPKVLSAYNKITFGKERIVLAGSPQDATGGELRKQWVSTGTCAIESSRFLSGKTRPQASRSRGPLAPTVNASSASATGSSATAFVAAQVYTYFVTSGNEIGESPASASKAITVTNTGDLINVLIDHPGSGTVRYFNVYRSAAGGTAASAKYIGRVALAAGASQTTFVDLGNKTPGFVTGFLVQGDTMVMKELASYSRLKLAVTDLSTPEAHFRFVTLAVTQPRKNVLIDNLRGSF